MKFRESFVTNSSSSSFILQLKCKDYKTTDNVLKKLLTGLFGIPIENESDIKNHLESYHGYTSEDDPELFKFAYDRLNSLLSDGHILFLGDIEYGAEDWLDKLPNDEDIKLIWEDLDL